MRGLLVLIPGLFSGLPITDSQVDDNDRKQQKLIHKKLTNSFGPTPLVACCVVLDQKICAQNITQHRQVKWLVQNLFGACFKGTVCTVSNVAGGSPSGAYDHGYVSG